MFNYGGQHVEMKRPDWRRVPSFDRSALLAARILRLISIWVDTFFPHLLAAVRLNRLPQRLQHGVVGT
jgi:hypothetical protein